MIQVFGLFLIIKIYFSGLFKSFQVLTGYLGTDGTYIGFARVQISKLWDGRFANSSYLPVP